MSLKSIIAITVGGLFALILFMGGMSWYSTAVSLTNATEAQWRQNQNSYDAFWKQVKEVAQVTEEYKESFRQVLIGTTELRYAKGAGGFAVAEANPALSPEMFTKLATVIEAGRNDFKRNQEDLLDKQRKLKDHLQSPASKLYKMFMDFPRVESGELAPPTDLDGDGMLTALDYPTITSVETKKVFKDGESEPVNVFGK